MNIDAALEKLGSIGKWQIIYWTSIGVACLFPGCFHMVAIIYIGYKPPHRCKIPEDSILNESIPYEGDKLSSCKMFVNYSMGNETTDCLGGWEYLGDDGPTIVTKWDLICQKDGLSELSQTILVLGVMAGAVFFTILSDRLGRKTIFMFSQMGMVVVGVSVVLTDNLHVFFVLRFLTGAFQQGIVLTGYILACEMFSAKYRTFSGSMHKLFWAFCSTLYPFIAMALKNWVHLQLFISLFGLLTIPLFKYLPESTMWLCANNRSMEAEQIIKNAAKMNGLSLPDNLLRNNPKQLNGYETDTKSSILRGFVKRKDDSFASYNLLDLFRNKRLATYIFLSSFLWIVVTLVYYGLILTTAQIGGNRFWNAFFSGIVEIPAYASSCYTIMRFGRKKPLCGYYILAGVSLLLISLTSEILPVGKMLTEVNIFLSNVGKFGITASFGIVFLYASELFPTNLRSQALGLLSFTGRIGNFTATFASYVVERYPRALSLSFGVLSILASILVVFLPETHNKPLPETIEDIETWFDKSKPKKCIIEEEITCLKIST